MIRCVAILATVIVLAACAPEDIAFYSQFAGPVDGGPVPCEQYVGTSRQAGFTEAELPVEHRLMWLESNCRSDVVSPAGAIGLLQVMPAWADDCGLTPDKLFNEYLNVACARHVFQVQGWEAWSSWLG